jgi:hypothetical protein
MAKALNLGLVAWSPLAGGVLTGKYNGKGGGEGRYSGERMQESLPDRERQDRVVVALGKVSKETGRFLAQVALAWLRQREIPVFPIIGARKLSQFQDNLESLTLTLTPDQVSALDEAGRIELGFPHDMYRRELVRTIVYGGMRDRKAVEAAEKRKAAQGAAAIALPPRQEPPGRPLRSTGSHDPTRFPGPPGGLDSSPSKRAKPCC